MNRISPRLVPSSFYEVQFYNIYILHCNIIVTEGIDVENQEFADLSFRRQYAWYLT